MWDCNVFPLNLTRLRFHDGNRAIPRIILKNISGNSIAESDNGAKSQWKCRKEERSEFRLCVGSRRIRVTVTNKFELSCNIDRSFHWAISLFSSPPFSLLDLLKFYAVSRWGPTRKFYRRPLGGRILYYQGKRVVGSASISLLEAYYIFPRSKERLQRDVSVGRKGRIKSRQKVTFWFTIVIIYIFAFISVKVDFFFSNVGNVLILFYIGITIIFPFFLIRKILE